MSDPTAVSGPLPLPDDPSLEWLRKHAKQRLALLRETRPEAKLADAQLAVAREHGFPSWRALKAHVDSLALDGRLFAAAREGDVRTLAELLDAHPDRLLVGDRPYGHTLLHVAARAGHLDAVNLLLHRGIDPNVKERGDDTYPMHWAAAAGHVDVVRRLADAGGDVIGHGDDHELEVIGWATCWDGCDDDAHHAVVALLLDRGARHHIFSAIAMDLAGEVRRIVAADPAQLRRPMSRNENHRLPLHFAVDRNRPRMVELLLELGADPLGEDALGGSVAAYAGNPHVGREVLAVLARHGGPMSPFYALALGDHARAGRLLDADGGRIRPGVLHLVTKRGELAAMDWLLARGADPNARWAHWDSDVTPLHLAAMENHPDAVRALLAAGADPAIRDSKHDGDALGWAEFFERGEIVRILRAHADGASSPAVGGR